MHEMKPDNEQVLIHRPLALADVRVQMVVPSLTTLLSNATWEAFSNMGPVSRARRRDNLSEDKILLFGPRTLSKMTAVVQLEPPRVALDLRLAWEELADTVPAILSKSIGISHQFLVL